jgi:hypothetical protein
MRLIVDFFNRVQVLGYAFPVLECRIILEFVHDMSMVYEAFPFGLTFIAPDRACPAVDGSEHATVLLNEVWPKTL